MGRHSQQKQYPEQFQEGVSQQRNQIGSKNLRLLEIEGRMTPERAAA
jgi:hypothetical protein